MKKSSKLAVIVSEKEKNHARRNVPALGEAAREAYKRVGFKSTRQASIKTGMHFTIIARMMKGEPCSAPNLIRWAAAVGEVPEKWLALAQGLPYDGPATVDDTPDRGGLTFNAPPVPESVVKMVEAAETNEDKVAVAFAYLRSLPDLRFGSDRSGTYAAKLAIIRTYEKYTGLHLVPPEVF